MNIETSDRESSNMRPIDRSHLQRLWIFIKSEDGPTAVEYAVMLSLIVAVCLSAITTVGTKANSVFSRVAGSIH